MHTLDRPMDAPENAPFHPVLAKLRGLSQLMRALSAGYALWVLWGIFSYWLNAPGVVRGYGQHIGRDLSAMADWQRWLALSLDLGTWFVLLLAVLYCWRFLQQVCLPQQGASLAAQHLSRCAWTALACEGLAVLLRPVQSLVLTLHLPAADQVWHWMFRPMDLLIFMFCISLLMFAYVFSWTLELAEENRSFV